MHSDDNRCAEDRYSAVRSAVVRVAVLVVVVAAAAAVVGRSAVVAAVGGGVLVDAAARHTAVERRDFERLVRTLMDPTKVLAPDNG